LTLHLYLDDCAANQRIRRVLLTHGHQVVIPADVGLSGAADEVHFLYARAHSLVLVTLNPDDFVALHDRFPDHPGLFLIYRDNDVTRDMSEHEIARAIRNLLASGIPIAGTYHTLNHWRY
jgi:predicted nuclease of predicted toxin-antitoxin system